MASEAAAGIEDVAEISRRMTAMDFVNDSNRVNALKERNLLRIAISHLSLREVAELFVVVNGVPHKSICQAVLRTLSEAIRKCEADYYKNKTVLWNCLGTCFRAVFIQCTNNADLKILKKILKLQRELDIKAAQQFRWLCCAPSALKQKWPLIASIIPALKPGELSGDVENMLMSELWEAGAYHSSGSVTSDCLLAWFAYAANTLPTCAQFLANCLTSSNKMRRVNCSRFWLAKLNTNTNGKLIIKETAALIVQQIREEIQQSSGGNCIPDEEVAELSFKSPFWDSEAEDEIWIRLDRLFFAWISLQAFFIRRLEEIEISLLLYCLHSYHLSVRLEAFRYAMKLISKKHLELPDGMIEFVLCNLDANDVHLRAALVEFIHMSDDATRDRLELALLKKLGILNPSQTTLVLELLNGCSSDIWRDYCEQMKSLFNEGSSEIRTKLLELEFRHPSQRFLQAFLVDKFKEAIKNNNTDDIINLVKALLRYKKQGMARILDVLHTSVADRAKSSITPFSEFDCIGADSVEMMVLSSGTESAAMALLTIVQYDEEINLNPALWMDVCGRSIVKMLVGSGSKVAGQCTTLPELYANLLKSIKLTPTLFISEEERYAVDRYYHVLRKNCEILTRLCEVMDSKGLLEPSCAEHVYDMVWNVLMRSRHKGVVDDCGLCFCKITNCFAKVKRLRDDIIRPYFEKTKKLFMDEECTGRNLAFCTVFKAFHETLGDEGKVIDFLIENVGLRAPRIAVRLMKVLKAMLYSATFDVTPYTVKVFKSVLKLYRTCDSMVRSTACHCFAALVHKLIDDLQHGMPLFMFIASYGPLWAEYWQQLEQTTVHDSTLILLLSLLENMRFVSSSFYTSEQLKQLELIVRKLVSVLMAGPNLRINRLIVTCLLHLSPRRRELTVRLKRILTQNLPLNLETALNYAVSKLEKMEVWESPSDPDPSCWNKTAPLPSVILKTQEFVKARELANNFHENFDTFEQLFAEIEENAGSTQEFWRLHAAHALVMLSRSTDRHFLLTSLRQRFLDCCRALLSDEIDCIRRVASRIAFEDRVDDFYNAERQSWNPGTKFRELMLMLE